MRFKISNLLWTTGFAALFCAACFLAPLPIAMIFLAFTLCITPAIWVSGACFGTGAIRAFFIGGLVAGTVPHVIASYYFYMMTISMLDSAEWTQIGIYDSGELLMTRIMLTIVWLVSGVFAVFGGATAVLTRWLVSSKPNGRNKSEFERPSSLDYQVLSGRLTTVSFDEAASSSK